jgi:hypothetical protein
MWKSIVLCVSLFGGAALGLATGARFVEAAALPAAAAIGLCLIGVVLILAAPAAQATEDEALTAATTTTAMTAPMIEPIDLPAATAAMTAASASNRTPTLPFQALEA